MKAWIYLMMVALALPAMAQDAVTLTYQGQLTDAVRQPVNGTREITYRLYPAADGGEAVWQEIHAEVDVVNGAFSSVLGLREPLPGGSNPLYLGVQVGAEPEFSPRMTVGGALRAQWAAVAEQANDVRGRDIHPRTVSIGDRPVIDENGRWVGEPLPAGAGTRVFLVSRAGVELGVWLQDNFYEIGGLVATVRGRNADARYVFQRTTLVFEGPNCQGRAFAANTFDWQASYLVDGTGAGWRSVQPLLEPLALQSLLGQDGRCGEAPSVAPATGYYYEYIRTNELDDHPFQEGAPAVRRVAP